MKVRTGFRVRKKSKHCADCDKPLTEKENPALVTDRGIKLFCSRLCKARFMKGKKDKG